MNDTWYHDWSPSEMKALQYFRDRVVVEVKGVRRLQLRREVIGNPEFKMIETAIGDDGGVWQKVAR